DNNAVWANSQLASNSPLTSNGTAVRSITGLSPNTTYYYRAYVTNSSGSDTSEVKSFQTLSSGGISANLTAYPLSAADDGYLYFSSNSVYRVNNLSSMGNTDGYKHALL